MSSPPYPYFRKANFVSYEGPNPTKPKRGTDLDAEFDDIERVLSGIQARAAEVQRDDGRLANGAVHAESLDPVVSGLLATQGGSPRGPWSPTTEYQARDVVEFSGQGFMAVTPHTSSVDFGADRTSGLWVPVSGEPFKQTGLGSAMRSVNRKLQGILELTDYVPEANIAAALNGAFDVSDAFMAACTEAMARGRWGVKLPAGRLLFGKTAAVTIAGQAGLSIEGAGMGLTQIIAPPTGNAIEITYGQGGNWWLNVSPSNALRIADLSVTTTRSNSGTGIYLDGGSLEGRPAAPTVLENIEVRAAASINDQAFLIGLHLHDCSSVWVRGCRFVVGGVSNQVPTGVKITATDATAHPASIFFDHCEWFYSGIGIEIGDNVEGVYLTQCQIIGGDTAVKWHCATESGLHVIGGHFTSRTSAFDLVGVHDFVIANSLLWMGSASTGAHIKMAGGNGFSITGNVFFRGDVGVQLVSTAAGSRGGIISGNAFNSQDAAAIQTAAGVNNVTIGTNAYTDCAAKHIGLYGTGFNHVRPRWDGVFVTTATAGTEHTVNVPLPAGIFINRPNSIMACAENTGILVYTNRAASTNANVVLKIVKRDGTAFAGGENYQLNVSAVE